MLLAHLRLRGRVGLLAAGALEGRERDAVAAHVDRCARCRAEHEALRAVVDALAADPFRQQARAAEPPIGARAMAARVEGCLQAEAPRGARPHALLLAVPAALAVLLLAVLLLPKLAMPLRPAPAAARATIPPPEASSLVTEEALLQIERNLAREHAARYLSEAGDLLLSVAATGLDCEPGEATLDVGRAPERSRELLERRRLVVDEAEVASARAVLDDVELALREVALLPSCVRRGDVERVRREVEDRQLLMRIRLMTRELEG
jgi:hypothetical protein